VYDLQARVPCATPTTCDVIFLGLHISTDVLSFHGNQNAQGEHHEVWPKNVQFWTSWSRTPQWARRFLPLRRTGYSNPNTNEPEAGPDCTYFNAGAQTLNLSAAPVKAIVREFGFGKVENTAILLAVL
jgi:hypothetical protein